ncbi:hypothetical protein XENOCAPTIV_001286 [Xenoophorus captivus]|uniref:Uncharacterized protein n=1 Tax=Xenoophorus captivus TaxID=1517983 RepID=A0ABV0RF27_9TELE
MVSYFNDFGDLCFERFGNRVKHWITFNNPWVSKGLKLRGTGAYKAAHHIIKNQNQFYRTDLQVHGDRDLRLMFQLPSDREEISVENTSVELHEGGRTRFPEQVTHNALQNT